MLYKKYTAAAVAIMGVLLLVILFVCANRPYSGAVWLSAIMMVVGCVALGITTVCLHDKPDSSFPVSVTASVVTFYYLIAVAILAIFPIFDIGFPFKYYTLVHLLVFGIWGIMFVVYRMWVRLVDEQDAKFPAHMEFRTACRLRISRIADEVGKSDVKDEDLKKSLNRLCRKFRYDFGERDNVTDIETRICSCLDELEALTKSGDISEMLQVVKVLDLEFSSLERKSRI